MKKTIIVAFICIPLFVNGQCAIEKYFTDDGYMIIEHKLETIQEIVGNNNNGNYADGFLMTFASLLLGIKPESPSIFKFRIAGYGLYNYSDAAEPRQTIFYFSDGSTIDLKADQVENISTANRQFRLYSYELTKEDFFAIVKKELKSITIIDYKNNKKREVTFSYPKYFIDQAQCLLKP